MRYLQISGKFQNSWIPAVFESYCRTLQIFAFHNQINLISHYFYIHYESQKLVLLPMTSIHECLNEGVMNVLCSWLALTLHWSLMDWGSQIRCFSEIFHWSSCFKSLILSLAVALLVWACGEHSLPFIPLIIYFHVVVTLFLKVNV